MKHVLFVCFRNAGRSQMATAFAQKYGEGLITAASGGTHPGDQVHDVVVEALLEKGIDLSQNTPRRITVDELYDADQVIVMGCGAEEFCLAPLVNRVIDWELDDPKDQPIETVREIREDIEQRVKQLIASLIEPKSEDVTPDDLVSED